MIGLSSKLFQVLELHSAVPFSERVDVVDVSNDLRCVSGELFRTQPPQVIALYEAPVNIR